MPRIVGIVQARMGSSRLPGKVMLSLGGRPVLEWVLARVLRSRRLSAVVVATTRDPRDAPVVETARRMGAAVFRGSENDVLARYAGAARKSGADIVIRVTSDCPLIDPVLIDRMLARFLAARRWDYFSNVVRRTFPRGLDAEIMTAATLFRAEREARLPYEREHVTPYLYGHPERFRIGGYTCRGDFSAHRWVLDTTDDAAFLKKVFDGLGAMARMAGWRKVLALLAAHPDWTELNAHVRQKPLKRK